MRLPTSIRPNQQTLALIKATRAEYHLSSDTAAIELLVSTNTNVSLPAEQSVDIRPLERSIRALNTKLSVVIEMLTK